MTRHEACSVYLRYREKHRGQMNGLGMSHLHIGSGQIIKKIARCMTISVVYDLESNTFRVQEVVPENHRVQLICFLAKAFHQKFRH